MLIFLGHGAFDSVSESHSVDVAGGATFGLRTGGGTEVLYAADPGADGVGAGVGSTSVAVASYSAQESAGLVGAFYVYSPCNGSWSSPIDQGMMIWAPYFYCGRCSFAGPSGAWSWSWQGGAGGIAAAWAPIGSDWKLFSLIPDRGLRCPPSSVISRCL